MSGPTNLIGRTGREEALASFGIALAGAMLLLTVSVLSGGGAPALHGSRTSAPAARRHGSLPVTFVPNRGQTDASVRYAAQGSGYAFYFTRGGVVLSFSKGRRGLALRLRPLGANPNARLEAVDRAPGRVNYFAGSGRYTNLPTYREVAYRGLWPGIDLVFRGSGAKLKYEFHLRPGADPADIRLAYRGADGLALGAADDLLVRTPLGTMRDSRPRSYELVGGRRAPVQSRYLLHAGSAYGFGLSAHHPGRPLVIDPGLVYSTLMGGLGLEAGYATAADGGGNAYVAGGTTSSNFPATVGAYDTTFNGGTYDGFVTKLNATGSAVAYTTFLGGSSDDIPHGIAVDGSGNVYVSGSTGSTGFPTTVGAYDTSYNGGSRDSFVTKLNPTGSALVYSTLLGGSGSDIQRGSIGLDANGNVYLTGNTTSPNFPTMLGTPHGDDAFATKINAAGSAVVYSTIIGGTPGPMGGDGHDAGNALAIDGNGSAWIAGETTSAAFPVSPFGQAFDNTYTGDTYVDGFVMKLQSNGVASYGTYLGGSGPDTLYGIAVDGSGNAYVTGEVPGNAMTGPLHPNPGGLWDAIVIKFPASPGPTLAYSTLLGGSGSGNELGRGIAVDANGNAYVTGETSAADFPTTTGAFDTSYNGGPLDAFVTKVNATGSAALYSTYFGGTLDDIGWSIAVDASGAAYVSGDTSSNANFPTTAGAYDTTFNGGGRDAFTAKLDTLVGAPYARPATATPLRVPLVPAYGQCTSPNTTHVTPLDYPACDPPGLASARLKLGTLGQGSGFARLKAVVGLPGPPDDADISIQMRATDVRNASNGSDYTGQVVFRTGMRITDSANGSSGEAQGTAQDAAFALPVPCTATGGSAGATCAVTSSADTLVPGFAKEGKLAIMSTLSLSVLDAGLDGSLTPPSGTCPPTCGSGDEGTFLSEGLFEP